MSDTLSITGSRLDLDIAKLLLEWEPLMKSIDELLSDTGSTKENNNENN
jgi:hypothetical protein